MYNWPLNNMGVRGADHSTAENLSITYTGPLYLWFPHVLGSFISVVLYLQIQPTTDRWSTVVFTFEKKST